MGVEGLQQLCFRLVSVKKKLNDILEGVEARPLLNRK